MLGIGTRVVALSKIFKECISLIIVNDFYLFIYCNLKETVWTQLIFIIEFYFFYKEIDVWEYMFKNIEIFFNNKIMCPYLMSIKLCFQLNNLLSCVRVSPSGFFGNWILVRIHALDWIFGCPKIGMWQFGIRALG